MTLASSRAHGQSVAGVSPAAADRVQTAFRSALQLGVDWLGPRPPAPLSDAAHVRVRGLVLPRDRSLERAVIADAIRRFWSHPPAQLSRFEEALSAYTSIRAIHELLEGSNFESVRFFGGFVPYPLRSILLSPRVADPRPRVIHFDEVPLTEDVVRLVKALQTIERYVGWPTMAQVLSAVRASRANPIDESGFAAALSEIRGADASRLVRECFRADAVFDYAIDNLQSSSVNGRYETTLTVARRGSGVFAAAADDDSEPGMPLLLRFADGTEVREWFDGAVPSTTLVYTSKTPLTYAAIDPEMMLLLDVDRANNSVSSQRPIKPLAIRLALHWMSWLQQTVLTYSALV